VPEHEVAAPGHLCLYQLIDLDVLESSPEALPDLVGAAEQLGLHGMNITHPC
jgi:shikimate dehydrogenase